jgi:putative membrane protein
MVLGSSGAAAAAPPEPDNTYLRSAHQADLTAIEAGRDAQTGAVSNCVRRVAAVVVRDHRKLDAQALRVVGQLGVELPPEPSFAQRRALANLRALRGSARYDAAWLRLMDQQHRQMLRLIDQQAARGTAPSARSVARAARPVVQMHLDMVRGGVCRTGSGASSVGAGDGGQAARATRLRELGAAGLIGAGLVLVLVGGGVALLRRRTHARPG